MLCEGCIMEGRCAGCYELDPVRFPLEPDDGGYYVSEKEYWDELSEEVGE